MVRHPCGLRVTAQHGPMIRYLVDTPAGSVAVVVQTPDQVVGGQDMPTVVLCPGVGQRVRALQVHASYFAANGYRSVRYESSGPTSGDLREHRDLAVAVTSVIAEALGFTGVPVFAGESLGGSLAVLAAGRLTGAVRRSVAISPVIDLGLTLRRMAGADDLFDQFEWLSCRLAAEELRQVWLSGYGIEPVVVEHCIRDPEWLRRSLRSALAGPEHVIVVIQGSDDDLVTWSEAEELFSGQPDVVLVRVPHAGHGVPTRTMVVAAIGSLEGTARTPSSRQLLDDYTACARVVGASQPG